YTTTSALSTLSLHDALPICPRKRQTHAPSARKTGHRPEPFVRSKTQPSQQLLGARIGAPGTCFGQCRLEFADARALVVRHGRALDRKSTRLNSSHVKSSYAV